MRNVRISIIVVLAYFAALLGCSDKDGPPKFQVSGTVTHEGKPIPAGTIVFEPDSSKGNTGPQTQAEIQDGAYETSSDYGVISGPIIVRIQGFDGKPDEEKGLPYGMPIFKEYHTELTLPEAESTQNFEIP